MIFIIIENIHNQSQKHNAQDLSLKCYHKDQIKLRRYRQNLWIRRRIQSYTTQTIRTIRDISEYSEYNCRYEGKKTSRSITDIIFYLELKEQKPEKKEEGAGEKKQEQKELDVDDLVDQLRKIIQEELKTREYRALLQAANNDIELIQEKYELSKKQQKIENLVGWLIKAIEGNYSEPIEKRKKTSFNNIEARQYNYEELERQLLERG